MGAGYEFIKKAVDDLMNYKFSSIQKPKSSQVSQVRFTNQDKTKGILADGTAVITQPSGRPQDGDIGYRMNDGTYLVHRSDLKIRSSSSTSSGFYTIVGGYPDLPDPVAPEFTLIDLKNGDKFRIPKEHLEMLYSDQGERNTYPEIFQEDIGYGLWNCKIQGNTIVIVRTTKYITNNTTVDTETYPVVIIPQESGPPLIFTQTSTYTLQKCNIRCYYAVITFTSAAKDVENELLDLSVEGVSITQDLFTVQYTMPTITTPDIYDGDMPALVPPGRSWVGFDYRTVDLQHIYSAVPIISFSPLRVDLVGGWACKAEGEAITFWDSDGTYQLGVNADVPYTSRSQYISGIWQILDITNGNRSLTYSQFDTVNTEGIVVFDPYVGYFLNSNTPLNLDTNNLPSSIFYFDDIFPLIGAKKSCSGRFRNQMALFAERIYTTYPEVDSSDRYYLMSPYTTISSVYNTRDDRTYLMPGGDNPFTVLPKVESMSEDQLRLIKISNKGRGLSEIRYGGSKYQLINWVKSAEQLLVEDGVAKESDEGIVLEALTQTGQRIINPVIMDWIS